MPVCEEVEMCSWLPAGDAISKKADRSTPSRGRDAKMQKPKSDEVKMVKLYKVFKKSHEILISRES